MSAKYLKVTGHLGLAMCAVLVATTAAAQKPRQLVVSATTSGPTVATFAAVSSADTLIVSGANFGPWPTVYLGGEPLALMSVSPDETLLTAQLPSPLEPGAYPDTGVSRTSNHAEREFRRRCGWCGRPERGPR